MVVGAVGGGWCVVGGGFLCGAIFPGGAVGGGWWVGSSWKFWKFWQLVGVGVDSCGVDSKGWGVGGGGAVFPGGAVPGVGLVGG